MRNSLEGILNLIEAPVRREDCCLKFRMSTSFRLKFDYNRIVTLESYLLDILYYSYPFRKVAEVIGISKTKT